MPFLARCARNSRCRRRLTSRCCKLPRKRKWLRCRLFTGTFGSFGFPERSSKNESETVRGEEVPYPDFLSFRTPLSSLPQSRNTLKSSSTEEPELSGVYTSGTANPCEFLTRGVVVAGHASKQGRASGYAICYAQRCPGLNSQRGAQQMF